jgi:predicted DNA-binding transcriptional regulator YafY
MFAKKYHLKSIITLQTTDIIFDTDKEIERSLDNAINIWFDSEVEPFEVVLLLDELATKILSRKPLSPTQKVIKNYKDNSSKISITITHKNEIIPIIKYWIPHIKIISPQDIKEDIKKDIEVYSLD